MLAIGEALHGLTDPLLLVPALPEMINCALPLFPPECEGRINDLSSGAYSTALNIGQVIGPIYGAYTTKHLGFRICNDVLALWCLFLAVFYLLFGEGFSGFKNSKWSNKTNDEDKYSEGSHRSEISKTEVHPQAAFRRSISSLSYSD